MNLSGKILFFFLLSSLAHGSLPPGVLSVNSLMEQWRADLQRRVEGLRENYVTRRRDNLFIFSNSKAGNCSHFFVEAGLPVAEARLDTFETDTHLSQRSTYTGCDKRANIVEIHYSKGENPYQLGISEFQEGRRNFELQPGETFRQYVLEDENTVEIFKLISQRQGNNIIHRFVARENEFLVWQIQESNAWNRHAFTFRPLDLQYERKYSNWHSHMDFPEFTIQIYQHLTGSRAGEVDYLDWSGERLSQQSFQQMFSGIVINGVLNTIKSIMEYHLYSFPSIEFATSGSQNQRINEELNLALIRLRSASPTDLELVQNLIREYLKAIEGGQLRINDRRPQN